MPCSEEIQILVLLHLCLLSPAGAGPAPHAPCSHRATLGLGGAARTVREKSKGGAPRTGQCEARCLQVP